jgi:hypothetical protein
VSSPLDPADRMVLFFRDQQSCVTWYLYLHHSGQSAIVCSTNDFTRDSGLRSSPDGEIGTRSRELIWCAPSIESFAFRELVESRLSQAIHDKERASDLDPEALVYLRHYVHRLST